MSISSLYPSIRPSLLLDFSNTKQLDPRITFSRPTTATYYDGKTVVKAEENLLPYSQEFDNAAVFKTNVAVTANTSNSPDGTATADTITENTSTSVHRVFVSSLAASGTYTGSVYLAAGSRQYVVFGIVSSSNEIWCVVDTVNWTITNTGASAGNSYISSSLTASVNGFYRVSLTGTIASASPGVNIAGSSSATVTTANPVYAGSSLTWIVWGAQVEQRSTVTAYTPTTTAPITNYIPALQTAVSNDARFDHDPVTGESKGLLIEEQRTNLLTYSEQFDNAVWSKSSISIIPNSVIAPNGTQTASVVYSTGASTFSNIAQVFTASGSVTISYFVKQVTSTDFIDFRTVGTDTGGAGQTELKYRFTFSTASWSKIGTTGTATSTSVNSVGNGWYRIAITMTATAYSYTQIYPNFGSTAATYGVAIWGAQLEAGSFPTSYIPTVASQVTRSADSASMTGSNFSSWYNQGESTLYADVGSANGSYARYVQIYAGGTGSGGYASINRYSSFSSAACEIYNGNNANIFATSGGNYIGKHALSFGTSGVSFVSNGATIGTTSSSLAAPVNATSLYIGALASLNQMINGTIKRIAYYPKRLSNTELQGLTS